eukprot:4102990-Amphidinium_carterae.3
MDDVHGVYHEDASFFAFVEKFRQRVLLKVEGPFSTCSSFSHLRRLHVIGAAHIEIHPNPKHAIGALTELGMLGCKPVATPRLEPTEDQIKVLGAEELTEEEARQYRSATGKLMYLALDRLDLAFALRSTSSRRA